MSTNLSVHPDCYLEPAGTSVTELVTTQDTWTLSLDADDVRDIVEGTCSIEVDTQEVAWNARGRSTVHPSNDKVLRRAIDTTVSIVSVTAWSAVPTVLDAADSGCSGESSTNNSGLVYQVPVACPAGTEGALADGTDEACELEQTVPLQWTTLTTGSLDLTDLDADLIRDLVLLAVDASGAGVCLPDEVYPAVDIDFARTVDAMGSCASNVGNIEGLMNVVRPPDPVTVVLAPAGVTCADAVTDLSIWECYPGGEEPAMCEGTEPELAVSPIDGLELTDLSDPDVYQRVGPYTVSPPVGASHNGFDLMIPCLIGATEPCARQAPDVLAVGDGTIVDLRSWPHGVDPTHPDAPANVGFTLELTDGWRVVYNLETRIACPSTYIPGDPLSIACLADVDAQIAALGAIDAATLADWNLWYDGGQVGPRPAGIPVAEGEILAAFIGSDTGEGAHLHFGVTCASTSYCPSAFYAAAPVPDVFDWFDACELDATGDTCELGSSTVDVAPGVDWPLCHTWEPATGLPLDDLYPSP